MIVLDAIVLAIRKHGGIATYFRELIARVPAARSDTEIWMYGSDDLSDTRTASHVRQQERRFLERYRSPVRTPDGAIFHSSYYRVSPSRNAINVVTVYDFIYERFAPRLARLAHSVQKRRALEKADAIISISESTKDDLLRFYPHISASKVHVVHLAAGADFFPLEPVPAGSATPPYVLFVGARGGYKNFAAAARAVAAVKGMKLLCVGGGPFTEEESSLLAGILSGLYEQSGYVSGPALNRLYNQAHCLVYPSLYEGFGIPILEAMAAGCPVIATRRSSMAEIAMENALMLDDPTPEAIAEAILALRDASTRVRYSNLGQANARRFSWATTVEQTLRIYSLLE
jgi:mannosyltransferase